MIFVRHAESLFNAETLEYVNRKKIEFDWAHLSQDHEYLASHKYSSHLVDATITPKGYEEVNNSLFSVQKQENYLPTSNQMSSWFLLSIALSLLALLFSPILLVRSSSSLFFLSLFVAPVT